MAGRLRAGQSGHEVPGTVARHPLAAVAGAPGQRVATITACRTCDAAVDRKVFSPQLRYLRRTPGPLLGSGRAGTARRPAAVRDRREHRPRRLRDLGLLAPVRAAHAEGRAAAPRRRRGLPPVLDLRVGHHQPLPRGARPDAAPPGPPEPHQLRRRDRVVLGNRALHQWYGAAGEVGRRFDGLVVPGLLAAVHEDPGLADGPGRALHRRGCGRPTRRRLRRRARGRLRGSPGSSWPRGSRTTCAPTSAATSSGWRTSGRRMSIRRSAWRCCQRGLCPTAMGDARGRCSSMGRPGEVVGERPYSSAKILLLAAVLALAVVVVVALVARH